MNIRHVIFSGIFSAFILLFAACATNRVNWDARVGNYTYDQAIVELGPPNKMAMLSDQSKVAEWYTGQRSGMSVGVGTGISRGPVGVGVGVPVGGRGVRVLRLTFDPDGVLRTWSR